MNRDESGFLSDSGLMLTILKAADEKDVSLSECADRIDTEMRRAGDATYLDRADLMDILAQAAAHLLGAGLIIPVDPRRFRLTPRGRRTLVGHPDGVDGSVLLHFQEFQDYVRQRHHHVAEDPRPAEYREGYEAFLAGRDLSENPFRFDTAKHLAWENGWSEARDDRTEHRPGSAPRHMQS